MAYQPPVHPSELEVEDFGDIRHVMPTRSWLKPPKLRLKWRFSFDTETWIGREAGRPVCLSYCKAKLEDPTPTAKLVLREEGARLLEEALRDKTCLIVGFNTGFDMAAMAAEYPRLLPLIFKAYAAGRIVCGLVREKLIHIAKGTHRRISGKFGRRKKDNQPNGLGFSLGAAVWRRFQLDVIDDKSGEDSWRMRYGELDGVPIEEWPPDAVVYARGDAELHDRVFLSQINDAMNIRRSLDKLCLRRDLVELLDAPFVQDGPKQAARAFAFQLMRCWGIRTNQKEVVGLRLRLAKARKSLEGELLKAGYLTWEDARPNKPKRVMKKIQEDIRAAYEEAGEAVPMTPKGDAVSTSGDTLKGSGKQILQRLATYLSWRKVEDTFLGAMSRGIFRPLHPGWNVLVESGRASCVRPNMTNQPRKGGFRECVEARPGMLFVVADYSTAELRSLAQTCLNHFGSSKMADALNEGRDLHVAMAADLLRITYEEAWERHIAGDKELKDHRQLSKAINFGAPGGLGAASFVEFAYSTYGVTVSLKQARRLLRKYKKTWPEMGQYFTLINSILTSQENRRKQIIQESSGRVRGRMTFTAACNTLFQGMTADGCKGALFVVSQECYTGTSRSWRRKCRKVGLPTDTPSPLHGSRPCIFVHDEIVTESPEEKAADAAERLEEIMIEEMVRYTPHVACKVDPYIAKRWYKDGEAVRDPETGKLLPWTPPPPKPKPEPQRATIVNIRKVDDFDVYIGRAGKGRDGYFGNPVRRGKECPVCGETHYDRGETIRCFRKYAKRRGRKDPEYRQKVAALHGKTLGCLHDGPCHGQVLAKYAERWYLQEKEAA